MVKNKRLAAAYKIGLLIVLLSCSVFLTSCDLFTTVNFGGGIRIPNILIYAAVFGGVGYMLFHKKK